MKNNFVFFGSAKIAGEYLDKLKSHGIVPGLIVTLAPAPVGRGRKLKANPTETWAQENGIPFTYFENTEQIIKELANKNFDFALVFAFGKILKKELLELENIKHGFINLHPSLLPALRGPSPIRSALLQNEPEALGVTYIKMDEKMDHGDIVLQEKYRPSTWPLPGRDLDLELVNFAAKILFENYEKLLEIKSTPQEHEKASFTKFFQKNDCEIDFKNISSDGELLNNAKFTACACDENPAPFFFAQKEDKKIRVKIARLRAENIDGETKIFIDKLIPEGKKEISWTDFKNFLSG